jgi:very-short-patch-repair endonuclease
MSAKAIPVGNVGEQTLAYQCIADKLPSFVQNYIFMKERKFELDFAWPEYRCGIEIQGGIFKGHAHSAPLMIIRDMEKSNLLVLCGWKVLRYTPQDVSCGLAIGGIKQLLARSGHV